MKDKKKPVKPTVDIKTYRKNLSAEQLANIYGNIPPLPTPENLIRKRGNFENKEHTWYEYVPSSYDGTMAVPLVVALHGGSSTGDKFATNTMFHNIADRENFIVVYPEATLMYEDKTGRHHEWNGFYFNNKDEEETHWLKLLVEKICDDYAVDRSRIYLTGHSNGDQMSLHFAVIHPEIFAACAGLNGPTKIEQIVDRQGNRINPKVPLPYMRWNGEKDPLGGNEKISRHEVNEQLNHYWIENNGCSKFPQFRLDGKISTKIYTSDNNAEVRFTEYKGGPHTLNIELTNVVWYEFFSRFARGTDGQIIKLDVPELAPPDEGAVALVNNCSNALVNGEIIKIDNVDEMANVFEVEGNYYVPVTFLVKAFGAKVDLTADKKKAIITYGEKTAEVIVDHPALFVEHKAFQFSTNPQIKDDVLWVPAQLIAEKLFDKQISTMNGVTYISDRETEISESISRTITCLLEN